MSLSRQSTAREMRGLSPGILRVCYMPISEHAILPITWLLGEA